MMQRRAYLVILALAGGFALGAEPALAQVTASEVDKGITVRIDTDGANVHFTYDKTGCGSGIPCLETIATTGPIPAPVSASGGCTAVPSGEIDCPAEGVKSITFVFNKNGSWSAYEGGGGQHARGPCSPAAVEVDAGANGSVVSVEAWNGCHETIVCKSGGMVAVDADAGDALPGPCISVIRH